MNKKFDELTKGMAQSVTRRAALKKFGVGLAGIALACLGLANKAEAANCSPHADCPVNNPHCCKSNCKTYTCPTDPYYAIDANYCAFNCPPHGHF
jgi:hypothetical protein